MDRVMVVNRFENLLREARHANEDLRFHFGNPHHLAAMCLNLRVLELAEESALLLRGGTGTSVPIIFRTMLEACADLRNLANSVDYLYEMNIAWEGQRLRVMKVAKDHGLENDYLKGIATQGRLDGLIEECEDTIKEYGKKRDPPKDVGMEEKQGKEKKVRALSISKRFEGADLLPIYVSIYWDLCTKTHNNINTLTERHVETKNGKHRVVFNKPISDEEVNMYADHIAGTVANCVHQTKLLVQGNSDGLESVDSALRALRDLFASKKVE